MTEIFDVLSRSIGLVTAGVVMLTMVLAWRRFGTRGTLVAVVGAAAPFVVSLALRVFYSDIIDTSNTSRDLSSQLSGVVAIVSFVGSILIIVALRRMIGVAVDSASELITEDRQL